MKRAHLVLVAVATILLWGSLSTNLPALRSGSTAAGDVASPLAAYLGFGHDDEADEGRYEQDETRRERIIASCMGQAGFVYIPQATSVLLDGESIGSGSRRDLEVELETLAADPNETYVRALTEAERERYWQSLIGLNGPHESRPAADMRRLDVNDDGRLDYRERWDAHGCTGQASRQVPGVFFAAKLLSRELEALEGATLADPGAVAVSASWVRCMNGRGFEGTDREAMYAAADEALAKGGDSTAMVAFRAAEKDCNPPYRAALAEIREKYETRFIEVHRDVLERYAVRR